MKKIKTIMDFVQANWPVMLVGACVALPLFVFLAYFAKP
jgi:hypothetical protein